MQAAGPSLAPLDEQMDTGSISIYIQDLVELVGYAKSPALPYPSPRPHHHPFLSKESQSEGTAAHTATASPLLAPR